MSWSPDGVVARGRRPAPAPSPRPRTSRSSTVADGARRTLTDPPPAHIGDISPAFSPDGRQRGVRAQHQRRARRCLRHLRRRRRSDAGDCRQCRRAGRGLGARRPASRLLLGPQRRDQPVACAGRRRRARAGGWRQRQGEASERRAARWIDRLRRLALRDQPDRTWRRGPGGAGGGQPDERSLELSSADFTGWRTAGVPVDPLGRLRDLDRRSPRQRRASGDGFTNLQVAAAMVARQPAARLRVAHGGANRDCGPRRCRGHHAHDSGRDDARVCAELVARWTPRLLRLSARRIVAAVACRGRGWRAVAGDDRRRLRRARIARRPVAVLHAPRSPRPAAPRRRRRGRRARGRRRACGGLAELGRPRSRRLLPHAPG